jgi:glycosyltransferase involved in cell wall biosynthesis
MDKYRIRVAYFIRWTGVKDGVFRKIITQINQWTENDAEVALFVFAPSGRKETWTSYLENSNVYLKIYDSQMDRLKKVCRLVEDMVQWKPNIVYLRYDVYYPCFGRLQKLIPTIIEINSDDVAEYKLLSYSRSIYNRLTRGRFLRQSKGLVFNTGELANMEHYLRYNGNVAVVSNGINLNEYQQLPVPTSQETRLVFIGTEIDRIPWHGIDKVMFLAKMNPDWKFDIIGDFQRPGKMSSNIVLHGFLDREQYQKILSKADIAIGTLALHRKGLNENPPLKSREYLAYGLPMIIGYVDTDFPCDVPFILRLPNVESNIADNLSIIRGFVEAWKGKRVNRDLVVDIDVKAKERQRLSFFRNVLDNEFCPR